MNVTYITKERQWKNDTLRNTKTLPKQKDDNTTLEESTTDYLNIKQTNREVNP